MSCPGCPDAAFLVPSCPGCPDAAFLVPSCPGCLDAAFLVPFCPGCSVAAFLVPSCPGCSVAAFLVPFCPGCTDTSRFSCPTPAKRIHLRMKSGKISLSLPCSSRNENMSSSLPSIFSRARQGLLQLQGCFRSTRISFSR